MGKVKEAWVSVRETIRHPENYDWSFFEDLGNAILDCVIYGLVCVGYCAIIYFLRRM